MVPEADNYRRSVTLSFNVHFVEEALRSGWETTEDVLYSLPSVLCPIMDEWSLTTFCISLLFVERILGSCLELVPVLLQIHTMELKETPDHHLIVDSTPLISPLIAMVGALTLCVANSSSNSLLLTPLLMTSQHNVVILYTLLGLFCLESLLVASILLLASHALMFPEVATTVNNLFLLVGVWLGSLIGSHFLRRHLYQSLGS